MATCTRCGKEIEFLKGEYYTPPDGKQIYLCKECLLKVDPSRKKIEEKKIKEKEYLVKNKYKVLKEFKILFVVMLFLIITTILGYLYPTKNFFLLIFTTPTLNLITIISIVFTITKYAQYRSIKSS